jgi:hypothetical protein
MRVLVFVTDDGTEAGTGPVLFLKDFATSALPPHPRGLVWKYFATVNEDDELLEDRAGINAALSDDEPFIAPRLIRRGACPAIIVSERSEPLCKRAPMPSILAKHDAHKPSELYRQIPGAAWTAANRLTIVVPAQTLRAPTSSASLRPIRS